MKAKFDQRLGPPTMGRVAALIASLLLMACASVESPVVDAPPTAESAAVTVAASNPLTPSALQPLLDDKDQVPAAWRPVLLPRQTKPVTTFTPFKLDGLRVVKVRSTRAYGKLAQRVPKPASQARQLAWQWRVDLSPQGDLSSREGEDAALKVCAAFDWPMERLPALDRIKLDTARTLWGDDLPSAALCYVWHPKFETGTIIVSPYTRRLRMVVAQGRDAKLGRWYAQQRNLHADFRRAFADEWKDGDMAPPLLDVLYGGDADNTGEEGLGYLRELRLTL